MREETIATRVFYRSCVTLEQSGLIRREKLRGDDVDRRISLD
jgi:hypothetical protein